MVEHEDFLYDLLCADLATGSGGIHKGTQKGTQEGTQAGKQGGKLECTGDLKQKIESFVRGNDSLNDLSTMEKISLSQSWLRRLQGYDFLDPYLKDP